VRGATSWPASEEPLSPSISEIAESFSRHRFAETYRFMLDEIEWTQVGGTRARGKDEVVAICEESAKYLTGVTTTFHRFKVIESADCVVIDSRANYVDEEGGSSTVASCDIYDFSDGVLSTITSYTVELEARDPV
jgi:hypothetical protein